jgi:pSer/pThr/pTyr-binding forkhead associated (FHA) protein
VAAHVFCTQCGQQNPDDAHFCARCGAALAPLAGGVSDSTTTFALPTLDPAPEEVGEQLATTADALPSGSALLVVKRGPNAGSRFLLDADVTTVGRHPDSDIFLDDVTVSRRHADVVREASGFVVRDQGSLNGTYVNRTRVEQATLAGGDEVQIGKYRLVFLAGPGAGEVA